MKPTAIVDHLLETVSPVACAREIARVQEAPQYYPGEMVYQHDLKFNPISSGNIRSYEVLGQDAEMVYMLNAAGSSGFVFAEADLRGPLHDVVPVMSVLLRDTGIKGYKQAYRLRIRQSFSRRSVATRWYMAYVTHHKGIVSDFEHLEGGKSLWRSLVSYAAERGATASLVDTSTGTWTPVNAQTPDSAIWSEDEQLKRNVLVLEIL